MKLRRSAPISLLTLVLSLVPRASQAVPPASATATTAKSAVVAPAVRNALAMGLRGLRAGRLPVARPGHAEVVIRLAQPATAERLRRLTEAGAELTRLDGELLAFDRFVPAGLDASALSRVAALPGVERIDLAPAAGLPPMDRSALLTHLAAARGARPAVGELTGAGVTVADLDTNANLFQPHFFRGDGGYYDWIDVDGDGTFTPGKDAIDLDRDGQASKGEAARWLKSETLSVYGELVPARPASFDPGVDWLYLDTNSNGTRDFGPDGGFDDSAPAFGEPLFTPDDVNQNGKLDPGERLVRLGTSKFSKVYVHVEGGGGLTAVDKVFKRGTDLTKKSNNFVNGVFGYAETLHATGVLTIVAGDLPLIGRRWVGFAPDADLLLGFEVAQTAVKAPTWAFKEKPAVVLHETAAWTGAVLDGSDPYSEMVTASATDHQIAHTCPVGNTGTASKHTHLEIAASQAAELHFSVPDSSYHYTNLTLNARTGDDLAVSLVTPDGVSHDIGSQPSAPQGETLPGGALFYYYQQDSTRGTRLIDVYIYSQDAGGPTVPPGDYSLKIKGSAAGPGTIDGYLSDDVSGWGEGVHWAKEIATDDRTIGIPAVADQCLAIGAMPGHLDTEGDWWQFPGPEKPDQRRAYSGQGPRIDGALRPDVLAPDNPWVATSETDFSNNPLSLGQVWPFSGTSGAGPHVTGVAALLAQASIHGLDAHAAIRKGARASEVAGQLPNNEYGYGALDAAGALGVPPDGDPPTVTLSASAAVAKPGESITLTATVVSQDDSKDEIRWDDGYDGSWDTPYATPAPRVVTTLVPGLQSYKVRARNAAGRFAEAIIQVRFDSSAEPVGGAGGSSGQGGDGGAGGSQGGTAGKSAGGGASGGQGGIAGKSAGGGAGQGGTAGKSVNGGAAGHPAGGGSAAGGDAQGGQAAGPGGAAGAAGTAGAAEDEDSGCGCVQAGKGASAPGGGGLLAVLALGLLRGRRRRKNAC
jgi:MYXO-CTERM domain-containing protein